MCSEHFVDGRPSESHPYPEINLGHNKFQSQCPRPKRIRSLSLATGPQTSCKPQKAASSEDAGPYIDDQNTPNISNCESGVSSETDNNFPSFMVTIFSIIITLLCYVKLLGAELLDVKRKLHEQTVINRKLKLEIARLRGSCQKFKAAQNSVSQFDLLVKNDSDVRFFTGLPSLNVFHKMHEICKRYVNRRWQGKKKMAHAKYTCTRTRKLFSRDEFFLVLLRLRLGLINKHLAKIFNISEGLSSQIFNTWLSCMDKVFSKFIFWPSKDSVHATKPRRYKCIPQLRAIIDCSEIFLETPKEPRLQSATWSDYKHHHTGKFLIAVAPNSMITFVSDLYNGRCSDKAVTLDSGFMDKLEPYDVIQADKGFGIQTECDARLIFFHVSSALSHRQTVFDKPGNIPY